MLEYIRTITNRIHLKLFGVQFQIRVEHDNVYGEKGRIFLQVTYTTPCNKTGDIQNWHGRKWYLSDYMTEDEVVKTSYAAYKAVIEHEIMETFLVDGIVLFNPHINYKELLKISHNEIKRD